ncbi:MAG: MBL fold metallo-hydrolase [Planctomycetota bacterium]|jgi:L-ascorbate metabolism protein UlaG (beta-lactamase superfamily)
MNKNMYEGEAEGRGWPGAVTGARDMWKTKFLVSSLVLGVVVFGCGKREGDSKRMEKGKEVGMAVTIQWLGHASFRISADGAVVYIDPWKLSRSGHDATVVLVSHSHYDHYSAEDIRKVAGADTEIVGPSDVAAQEKNCRVLKPGETVTAGGVSVMGVASYNPNKQFHVEANQWLGFVVEIGSKRIYYAGDTDVIDQMKTLENIDVALLPVGGTYTMNAEEAAAAVQAIKPVRAIPYHWGDIVGGRSDAERFAEGASCEVAVLKPGESLEL